MRSTIAKESKYVDALLALGVLGGSGGGGITQLTGDVQAGPGSGAVAATVLRVHGATVPIAGALTTGNVLQVSGAAALSYGPLNVGGGANFVTGVLPRANQQNQVMAGDVTGTTGAATVVAIQGTHVDGTAPAVNQQLVFNGATWGPATVTGTNGVKAITQVTSAGGATSGVAATVVSSNLAIGAGQTVLVRGYVQLQTIENTEVAQVQSFLVQIVVDGGALTGTTWSLDTPAGTATWQQPVFIEAVVTGLPAANHTFAIQVTSLSPGVFTNASKMIVEQLIPSG